MYLSRVKPDSGSLVVDMTKFPDANDNGFVSNVNSFGSHSFPKEESVSYSTVSEPSRLFGARLEGSKKSMSSVSALKEYVRSK